MKSEEKAKVVTALKEFIQRTAPSQQGILCTVTELEESTNTCYCEPIGDYADLFNVRYTADGDTGLKFIPKVGSKVYVQPAEDGAGYISMWSDLKEIDIYLASGITLQVTDSEWVFNGGTDGMVKVVPSVSKLNNLENKVNAILTAITTTWAPVANDGGAALKALFASLAATTLAPLTPTVKSDLEDTKIKH